MLYLPRLGKEGLLCLFLLLILTCVFFWKVLTSPDKMIYSKYSDVLVFSDQKYAIVESFKKYGYISLWDTSILGGMPILGKSTYQLLYPITILFLLFPIELLLGYLFMIHIFLAGVFMYFFTKIVGMNRFGSIISAIIFMFNGFLILGASAGHIHMIYVAAYIPITFLLLEVIVRDGKILYGLILGVILALLFLTGHVQYFLYSMVVFFFYVLYRSFTISRKRWRFGYLIKILPALLVSILVLLGLSAVQLLPSYEFSKYSNRSGGIDYFFATRISLPIRHLITFVIPEFFGTPIDDSYISTSNFWELCVYIGIMPMIMVLFGILFQRNKFTLFFVGLIIFSILFAFGGYGPLFPFFYKYVPMFDMFRDPSRFLLFYIFSVSILAGFGAEFLTAKISRKSMQNMWRINKLLLSVIILSIVAIFFVYSQKEFIFSFAEESVRNAYKQYIEMNIPIAPIDYYLGKIDKWYVHVVDGLFIFSLLSITSLVIIISYLKGWVSVKQFKTVLVIFIFLDLLLFGIKYIDVKNPDELFENDVVKFLKKDTSLYRVFALDDALPQHMTSKNNIQIVEGGTGLQIEYYKKFLDIVGNRSFSVRDPTPVENIFYPNLVDLLNAKYIVSNHELKNDRFELIKNDTILIYLNKHFLPRAFVVRQAKIIERENDIFDELRDYDFNPKEYVILEKEPTIPLTNGGNFKPIEIEYYSPDLIRLNVTLDNPGFLVLSDVWYPGWKAYDNGVEIEIYKANYALRSIPLVDGKHNIEFRYEPESFKSGLSITTITIVLLIFGIAYSIKSSKRYSEK